MPTLLELIAQIEAGGPGSGRHPYGKSTKDLSQAIIKSEVEHLTPLMTKVGNTWVKAIKAVDPKADVKMSVFPTGLFRQKNLSSPMVLEKTWGLNVSVRGQSSKGDYFGISFGMFPDKEGIHIKIQDSSLPDAWKGHGIFSKGLALATKTEKTNLSGKMYVHVNTNPRVWKKIANKVGLEMQAKGVDDANMAQVENQHPT